MSSSKLIVAVLGSTGSVGRATVANASTNPSIGKVIAITRRPYFSQSSNPPINENITESIVTDLHNITPESFKDASIVYCALGTTRADAGSAESFIHNDRDLIIKCANVARQAGVKSFHLTSSGGADSKSSYLYLQSKGQIEEAVKEIGFEHCSIYRPAVLDQSKYPRPNKRFVESTLVGLMHYLPFVSRTKYANTRVEDVAAAMINGSLFNQHVPFHLYEGTQEILAMKNHIQPTESSRDSDLKKLISSSVD